MNFDHFVVIILFPGLVSCGHSTVSGSVGHGEKQKELKKYNKKKKIRNSKEKQEVLAKLIYLFVGFFVLGKTTQIEVFQIHRTNQNSAMRTKFSQ